MADASDKVANRHHHRRRESSPSRHVYGPDFANISMPQPMEIIVTPEMAFYCFDVLISKLKETLPTIMVDIPATSHPLFVTWERRQGQQDAVLNSLGTFEPVPLTQGLTEFTIACADKDQELKQIPHGDYGDLQVTVGVLCKFETGKHFLDWTIGVHGIRLTLPAGRDMKKRVANFLPEHPVAAGWTKVETIDALMLKAGFFGKITGHDRQALKITRFQTQEITRNYDEFNRFRNWKTRKADGKQLSTVAFSHSSRF